MESNATGPEMSDFDREIAARTAIGEARGEGHQGMLAVMWTGWNRFTSKKWYAGRTIAGTFLKNYQYSCWLPHDANFELVINLTSEISLFAEALALADSIMKGDMADPTLGATHYYATSMPTPPKWVEAGIFTAQIGNHRFYKGVA